MNRLTQFSTALMALMLTGCGQALKSDYQRPLLSVPDAWRVQDTGEGVATFTPHWWDNFGDPQLSRLIVAALQSNHDLALAGIKLKQARLAAGLSDLTLTPDFSVNASASNSKNLRRDTASVENYSNTLTAAYELDLWGKLARTREQSDWQAKASEQDLRATALTLIGTVSQLYWQIASLNQQIGNLQRSLDIARDTLRRVTSRWKAGDLGQLDYLQAQQTVLNRENSLHDLSQQREESRNALAILLSRPPGQYPAERRSLDSEQSVPVAQRLPLETIAKRPDVRAAELNLRAALAGSDVARLNFYPTLTLNASLNAGASVFRQWFSNPARTLGSALDLPFIQWNKVRLTIAQSDLEVQSAAIQFQKTAYSALQDIDNAMSQRLTWQQEKQRQRDNLALSQQRLTLVESQYRHGAVAYQTLLDAQNTLLDSENALLNTQYNYLYSTMKLWLALGGGEDDTVNH
ncbi:MULTISPECIES: efflux transporter outer membrane subunit [Pantoea]|uniref:efflux transporter outer membrane subunit n=1 Tax=Pantoea TaxID=53335 RepID=UPI000A221A1F|nr:MULTISPECIES: efflux transporter outer membrane subunit [Pantoea]MBW1251378.1 efflux transporter outer membrane subunit [Pantoea allii]MBW1261163.1 efflux transporter outer membrane subunit [Pantoea allii]MBW1282572.1 efflux transporter outer membrane subunit [Pantoea allii]ORM82970.1 RND transporter [Pantoea allii]PBK00479.1 RND transporter [Pantoea allii]